MHLNISFEVEKKQKTGRYTGCERVSGLDSGYGLCFFELNFMSEFINAFASKHERGYEHNLMHDVAIIMHGIF